VSVTINFLDGQNAKESSSSFRSFLDTDTVLPVTHGARSMLSWLHEFLAARAFAATN